MVAPYEIVCVYGRGGSLEDGMEMFAGQRESRGECKRVDFIEELREAISDGITGTCLRRLTSTGRWSNIAWVGSEA